MMFAALLLSAAAAPSDAFNCEFKRAVISSRAVTGWDVQAPNDFKAAVPFKHFVVHNRAYYISVEQAGDPMRLSVAMILRVLSPAHLRVTAERADYCKLVDTDCIPTLEFFRIGENHAAAAVRLSVANRPTPGGGGHGNLKNLDLLYDCVRSGTVERG